MIVEISLVIVPNVFRPPNNVFEFISIAIRGLRICTLIILPCTFVGFRNRTEEYDNIDAERQSLLRKALAPKRSSSDETTQEQANGEAGYGATTARSGESSTAAQDETDDEAGENDNYFKKQRENRERFLKRLKENGNWWTYAKGFIVRYLFVDIMIELTEQIFFPYIWPIHSKALQFRAVLVLACLLTTNVLNVMIPRQIGLVMDTLVNGEP